MKREWIKLFFAAFLSIGALSGIIALIQFNAYTSEKNRLERMERKADGAKKSADQALLYVIEVRNRLLWPAMATKDELAGVCK